MSKRTKKSKKLWVQLYRGTGQGDHYFLNGDPYVHLDAALQLAHKKGSKITSTLRVYMSDKYGKGVMLGTHRTSSVWTPVTERMPFEKAWPVFESYARML